MSRNSVTVHQLADTHGAYLNVRSQPGMVGVWLHLDNTRPTFLIFRIGGVIELATFSDIEWAKEWFIDNGEYLEGYQQLTGAEFDGF